jgi:hypothetical protein
MTQMSSGHTLGRFIAGKTLTIQSFRMNRGPFGHKPYFGVASAQAVTRPELKKLRISPFAALDE